MHKQTEFTSEAQSLVTDTLEDMLERIFAVAELIAKSSMQPGNLRRQEPVLRPKTQNDDRVVR